MTNEQRYIEKDITDGERFLFSIWETIGEFPKTMVDWDKEWYKHLEERHG